MEHRTLKMIRQCAADAGCEILDVDDSRRHIAVTVGKEGIQRRVTVSVSASDRQAQRNITRDMKNVFLR